MYTDLCTRFFLCCVLHFAPQCAFFCLAVCLSCTPQCEHWCILVCLDHQTLGSCKLGAIVSATWKCATTTHCICHLLKLPSPPRLTFPYDLLLLLPTHPLAFPPSNSYPLTNLLIPRPFLLLIHILILLSAQCSSSSIPPPFPPLLCFCILLQDLSFSSSSQFSNLNRQYSGFKIGH